MSRDHSKSLFEFNQSNYPIFIEDPFKQSDLKLENTFLQSADNAGSAMKAIANLISEIAYNCSPESELVLIGTGSSGLFLPGIASGLRAYDFSIVGYIFINSPLPGAISLEHPNYEFFKSLPLLSDWPDAPVNYLWNKAEFEMIAKEAELRGWQVLNEVNERIIEETANSLFF